MKNEERVSATRGRLIDAAINALSEIGYHRTTFVEVSRRSELSRGAIHHHFTSIPDLMTAVTRNISTRVKESMNERLSAWPPGADTLDSGIDLVWQQMHEPPFRALNQIRSALATDNDLKLAVQDDVNSVWEWMQVQARGMLSRSAERNANPDSGRPDTVDSALTKLVLSSLCGAACHDFALGSPPEDPDRATYLATLKEMVRRFESAPREPAAAEASL